MNSLVKLWPPRRTAKPALKILLVCSSGGHLAQLMQLQGWWKEHHRTWVSFDTPDATSLLEDETVVFGHHPTTRNIPNLIRNFFLSVNLLLRQRPDLIVSNGAGMAVPFFWVGWLLRIPSVWIEVYDRIDSPTMTGRLVRPVATAFCVQWPEQTDVYPGAHMIGKVW